MNYSVFSSNADNVIRGEFKRGLVARIVDQIKVWNENRNAVRELNMLSDRLLRDIVVERAEIQDVVSNQRALTHVMARRQYKISTQEIRKAA